MANSFVSVRAVEGQTDFPFNFTNGYLHEDHIRTYVDGVEVSRTISGGVAIIAPVSEGQEVIVARQSPQTPVITFEDGSILNKQNVDTQNRHAFMLAEEAAEQRDFFALGDIDMNYHKIIHVASGTDQYDVVNKGQFDYFLAINEDAAQRAEQAADEAAASAQLAGSHASTAQGASAAAEAYAEAAQGFAEDAQATVDGFDAHAEAKKDEVTAEGDDQSARVTAIGDAQVSRLLTEGTEQVQRVQAEGDVQYGRAKTEADRAQTYAEILERPYEDMGGHTIQQGYPPVPSFSSMWTIIDGGIDPIDGITQWNIGDVLVYSVQTATWTRLAGNILSGGGEPLPIEILDDLIMQQGKKIRFRIDEFVDTVGLMLDADGDVLVGEVPTTPSTGTPAPKIGLAATELYHVTGTDAGGAAIKSKILSEATGVKKAGDIMPGEFRQSNTGTIGTKLTSSPEGASLQFTDNGSTGRYQLVYDNATGRLTLAKFDGAGAWVQDIWTTTLSTGVGIQLTNPEAASAQGSAATALTRKDYVDARVANSVHNTGTALSETLDWNTLTSPGVYRFGAADGVSFGANGPSGSGYAYGLIVVFVGVTGITQRYYPNNTGARPAERTAFDGATTFTPWRYTYHTSSPPSAGEVGALPSVGGVSTGPITISNSAPIVEFHETDTTKRYMFVLDGYGFRLNADSTEGATIFQHDPSDNFLKLSYAKSMFPQHADPAAFTRKDYVTSMGQTKGGWSGNTPLAVGQQVHLLDIPVNAMAGDRGMSITLPPFLAERSGTDAPEFSISAWAVCNAGSPNSPATIARLRVGHDGSGNQLDVVMPLVCSTSQYNDGATTISVYVRLDTAASIVNPRIRDGFTIINIPG